MKRLLLFVTLLLAPFAFAQTAVVIEKIAPASGPSDGGTEVTITGSGFQKEVDCILPCPPTVMFGEIEVPVRGAGLTSLVAITPAHPPGPVAVTVKIAGKTPVTSEGAFTFALGVDDDHERVLLPIYLESEVPGAFGSRWMTDLWLRNNSFEGVELAPWPCAPGIPCPAVFPLRHTLPAQRSINNLPPLGGDADGNPSRLLYVDRAHAPQVAFRLRFADVSRASLDGGVEMPVLRDSEMLREPAQLFDVPLGAPFRVLLRVYEVAYSASSFRVTIYPQTESDHAPSVHSTELTATSASGGDFREKAGYVHFDVSDLLRMEKVWPQRMRIEVTPLTPGSRFWAFVSITNNDTQVVTLVTPQ